MLPFSLGFRMVPAAALLLALSGCSARKTLIDMRTMPVWSPTDTAVPCVVEAGSHYASRANFPSQNGMNRNLGYEFFGSYHPEHLPAMFFDFRERFLVALHYDACGNSPALNSLSIHLIEIPSDSLCRAGKSDPTTRDSLFIGFDRRFLPSDTRTWATTTLRILQVGQEGLGPWSQRLARKLEEAKESGTWQGTTQSENIWLLNHAWLPDRPRTLVMEFRTEWGSKTLFDTVTVDVGAKRLFAGFQP
ncbi:MAG: hypothetical protein RL318_2409 [Fibrobacterota bacterium]|jgi:hypothetical protein